MSNRDHTSAHALVRNTGVGKDLAFCDKAVLFIKCQRLNLRVEDHLAQAAFRGNRNQLAEQRRADASITKGLQDGHAADMSVGQQSSGADGQAVSILCNDVSTIRIDAIPFELERDILFVDEYDFADVLERSLIAFPVRASNPKRCAHAADYSQAS